LSQKYKKSPSNTYQNDKSFSKQSKFNVHNSLLYDKIPLIKQPQTTFGGRTNSVDYKNGAFDQMMRAKLPINFLSPVYSSREEASASVLGFGS